MGRRRAAEAAPGLRFAAVCAPRKHGAGDRKAADGASGGERACAKARDAARRRTDGCATRRSIPLDAYEGRGKTGLPGATQRIRAMAVVFSTISCLKSESQMARTTHSAHPRESGGPGQSIVSLEIVALDSRRKSALADLRT